MKIKLIFINIFLTLTASYIGLLSFSAYEYSRYIDQSKDPLKSEWEEKLKAQKISLIKSGYKPTYLPDLLINQINKLSIYPIGSMPLTKSYLCDEGYGLITYKTDRFGLRNSNKKWNDIIKNSNIFVIGDSFVHGFCVPDKSTIIANIEKNTKKTTINLGVSSNGPYEYISMLKLLVNPIIKNSLKENKVVLVFYPNDNITYDLKKEKLLNSSNKIVDLSLKESISPTKEYTKGIMKLIYDNYPSSLEGMISEVNKKDEKKSLKNTYLFQLLTLNPIRTRTGLSRSNLTNLFSNQLSPSQRSIVLLSDVCKDLCKPTVVYIPMKKDAMMHKLNKTYKEELIEMTRKMKITFIDGEDVIDKNNLEDYAPKGGHLSKKGYKKISDLISENL